MAEAQDKDVEIGVMNVMKDTGEDMNNSINKIDENTNKQWNEVKTTVQDMKVNIKSLKKAQTEVKLELKNLGSQTKALEVSLTNRTQKNGRENFRH